VRQDRFEHRIARFDSGLHRPEDSVAQVTTDMRQQPSIARSADVANVEDGTNSVRNCDSERSGSRIGAIFRAPSLMCKALLPRAQLNQPCTKELQTCRSTTHSLFF
jgi:hypothetical protein